MADISLRELPDAFNRGEFTAGETIAAGNVVAWNASTSSIQLITKAEITDPYNRSTTITNPVFYNTTLDNQFGYCIASDENFILVGVPFQHTADNENEGVVYVYNATTLAFITTLTNPYVSNEGSQFGYSVAICNGFAVVGARYDSEVSTRAGKIILFETNNWTIVNDIKNPNVRSNSSYDYFGSSVFVNDTYYGGSSTGEKASDLTAGSGAVWVYDIATHTGYFIDNPNIGTNAAYDSFGVSTFLSCNSDHLLVGASKEDDTSTDQGAAYVFDLSSGTPTTPLYSIIGPNTSSGSSDQFGASSHINSSTFAVGAIGEAASGGGANSGIVYVYSTSTGSLLRTIVNPNNTAGDKFGTAIWQTDDYIYVGAIGYDGGTSNSGAVYQFDNTGTLNNTFLPNNTHASDIITGLHFGNTVAAINDKMFVGAPGFSGTSADEGKIYTYNITETNADKWIGIAHENIASGEIGTVNLIGAVDRNQSSLTIGSEYYLKSDGTLSTSSTIYGKLGRAISETDIILYTNTDTSNLASISYVDALKVSNLTELGIVDGTSNQVLATDGNGTFSFVTLTGVVADALTSTDISVTQNAAGTAALTYDSATSTFTYTPPDLSSYLTSETTTALAYVPASYELNFTDETGTVTNINLSNLLDDTNLITTVNTQTGDVVLGLLDLGITDGTAGQILSTDGAGNFSFVADAGGIALTDLSITTAAAGTAALAYDNSTGVFTYTPPDLSSYATTASVPTVLTDLGITDGSAGQILSTDGAGNFSFVADAGGIALTDLSITTAAAGTAALAYDNTTGVFTYTPPDLSSYATTASVPTVLTDLSITDGTTGQILSTDGSGNFSFVTNPTTALAYNTGTTTLTFTNETGTDTTIDLSGLLDEDARSVASGTLDAGTGIVTFTRDDTTTFTLDLSPLLDDTNLVTSVNGYNGTVTLALTDLSITDGTSGQVLKTDGSGNFSFANPSNTFGNIEVGVGTDGNVIQGTAGSDLDLVIQADGDNIWFNANSLVGVSGNFMVTGAVTISNMTQINSTLTVTGNTTTANIVPNADLSRNLGSSTERWSQIFAGEIRTTDSLTISAGNGLNLYSDVNETVGINITNTGVVSFNSNYSFPITDGTTKQLLRTDGAGVLTFEDPTNIVVIPSNTSATFNEFDLVAMRPDSGNNIFLVEGIDFEYGITQTSTGVLTDTGVLAPGAAYSTNDDHYWALQVSNIGLNLGSTHGYSEELVAYDFNIRYGENGTALANDGTYSYTMFTGETGSDFFVIYSGTTGSFTFEAYTGISPVTSFIPRAPSIDINTTRSEYHGIWLNSSGDRILLSGALGTGGPQPTFATLSTGHSEINSAKLVCANGICYSGYVDETNNVFIQAFEVTGVPGTGSVTIGTPIQVATHMNGTQRRSFDLAVDSSNNIMVITTDNGSGNVDGLKYHYLTVDTNTYNLTLVASNDMPYHNIKYYVERVGVVYAAHRSEFAFMLLDPYEQSYGNDYVFYNSGPLNTSNGTITFSNPWFSGMGANVEAGEMAELLIDTGGTPNIAFVADDTANMGADGLTVNLLTNEGAQAGTNEYRDDWVGWTFNNINTADTFPVELRGNVYTNASSLTPGQEYYIDRLRNFTTVDTGYKAGYALTATDLQTYAPLGLSVVNQGGSGSSITIDNDARKIIYNAPVIPVTLTQLNINDGTAGQVLTTDGSFGFTFEDPAGGGLAFVSITDITTSNQNDLIYAGLTTADDASFVATKLMVYYNGSLLVPGTNSPTYDFFVDSGAIGAESNGWRINFNFTPLDGSTIVVYRLS